VRKGLSRVLKEDHDRWCDYVGHFLHRQYAQDQHSLGVFYERKFCSLNIDSYQHEEFFEMMQSLGDAD
jgi:hypothetical protein